jgi:hypothetical protein
MVLNNLTSLLLTTLAWVLPSTSQIELWFRSKRMRRGLNCEWKGDDL